MRTIVSNYVKVLIPSRYVYIKSSHFDDINMENQSNLLHFKDFAKQDTTAFKIDQSD